MAGVAATGTDLVVYYCHWTDLRFAPLGVPIGWDCDGITGGVVDANVNGDLGFGQRLVGFDDWAHVRATLASPPYQKGFA